MNPVARIDMVSMNLAARIEMVSMNPVARIETVSMCLVARIEILLDRLDFHMIDNLSIAVHVFVRRILMSLLVD